MYMHMCICVYAYAYIYILYVCLYIYICIEGGRLGECGKRPDAESELLKPHCFRRRRIVTPHCLTPNCLLTPHWVVTTNSEAAMGGDAELLTPH